MGSLMETCPSPNSRSTFEESDGGAAFTFWSLEAHFLEFECGSGVWARE